MVGNPLKNLGNVPLQVGDITSCFPHLSSYSEKLRSLEKSGEIIRLKRGMYVVDAQVSGIPINMGLCANHIYGPSYVSLQWALRQYGLIPENVRTVTSVTTKRSRIFENKLGRFTYYQVKADYFSIGIKLIVDNGVSFLMASPEKSLCDTILHDSYLPAQSTKRLEQYLFEDLRLDAEALCHFDTEIIAQCAMHGMKTAIFHNLIKIINRL